MKTHTTYRNAFTGRIIRTETVYSDPDWVDTLLAVSVCLSLLGCVFLAGVAVYFGV